MKTEDKNNVPKVRIVVLGNVNVGKSALTVRYLTKRFIGEYRSNTNLLYSQTITHENRLLDVEIIDISTEQENDFPIEQIQWADAFIVVYSITDRLSFEHASKTLMELKQLQSGSLSYLVANKADLGHLREVSQTDGASLAANHGVAFCEISVADNSPNLYKIFEKLLIESRVRSVKPRKFSVSKMIGTLIRYNVQKQPLVNHGTVVPCSKDELHKSKGIKSRPALTATMSL